MSEAQEMKSAILECVDELEHRGFGRSQIAATMAGISMGVVAANEGLVEADRIILSISDAIYSQLASN